MKTSKKLVWALVLITLGLGVFGVKKAEAISPGDISASTPFQFINQSTISGTIDGTTYYFADGAPTDGTYSYQPSDSSTFCKPDGVSKDDFGLRFGSKPGPAGSISVPIKLGYTDPNRTGCTTLIDGLVNVTNSNNADSAYLQYNGATDITNAPGFTSLDYKQVGTTNVYASDPTDQCGGGDIIVTTSAGANTAKRYQLTNSTNNGTTDVSTLLPNNFSAGQCYIDDQTTVDSVVIGGSAGTTPPPEAGGGAGGGSSAPAAQTTCEANSGGWSFAWAACPILDAASHLSDALLKLFEGQLSFTVGQLGDVNAPNCGPKSNDTDCGAAKIHLAWNVIRDLSSAGLVIIMLIMVISQAFGGGPFDAYTIRKLLPKLVAAVILIQISWSAVAWVIDLVNDVGTGVADIMYYPFGGSSNMGLFNLLAQAKLTSGTLATLDWAAILVAGALTIAFLFTMMGVALTAILALLFALLTLVFRKILIITLLIFAPLAVLAWILPGTERYWKMWRDNLMKALFMFPIVVAIVAAGRIFAYIVGTQNNGVFLNLIFILVGFFGPLFILPKTFKWGGQAMQLAGNGIAKAGSQVSGRQKKFLDKRQEGWSAERRRQSEERYKNGETFNPRKPSSYWQRPIDLLRSGQFDVTQGVGEIKVGGKTLKKASRRREQAMIGYTAAGAESEEKDLKAANTATQLVIERIHPDEQDAYARALAAGQKLKVDEHGRIMAERDPTDDSLVINKDTGEVVGATDSKSASLLERRAGLDQITRLGGEGNIEYVQKAFERAMATNDPEQIEMMNKFTTANVQSLFSKLPHIYKNNNYARPGHKEENDVVRTVEGLNPNDITALSGVGMKTLRDNLLVQASQNSAEFETDASGNFKLNANGQKIYTQSEKARRGLQRLTSVFEQTVSDPTLRGRIPSAVSQAMYELTDTDNKAIQYNPPGGGAPQGLKVDSNWGIDDKLKSIASRVNAQGVVTDPTAASTATAAAGPGTVVRAGAPVILGASPGEIRVQHETAVSQILPSAVSLAAPAAGAAPNPNREAFKLQLQSNPDVVKTLTHAVAYEVAAPEHIEVLASIRNDAQTAITNAETIINNPASSPQQISQATAQKDLAQTSWNNIANQLQQAHQQRIDEQVAGAAAKGFDPLRHRDRAQAAITPRIMDLEAGAAVPPAGTPDLRKL